MDRMARYPTLRELRDTDCRVSYSPRNHLNSALRGLFVAHLALTGPNMNPRSHGSLVVAIRSHWQETKNGAHIMPVEIIKEGDSGGNAVIGFILGGVLIAVAVVGFFMWDNFKSGGAAPAAPAAVHVIVKGK